MRTRLIASAMGLALVVSGSVLAGGWQNFTSKTGKFTVQMPGAPKYEKRTVQSAAGPLGLNNYSVGTDGGATAYIVSFTDYPAGLVAKSNPTKMLTGARDGQLKNLKAKASVDKVISVNGNPGRDVTFAGANNFTGRCKMFLVKNRLYQVLALTQNNASSPANFARFVDSFKLTK